MTTTPSIEAGSRRSTRLRVAALTFLPVAVIAGGATAATAVQHRDAATHFIEADPQAAADLYDRLSRLGVDLPLQTDDTVDELLDASPVDAVDDVTDTSSIDWVLDRLADGTIDQLLGDPSSVTVGDIERLVTGGGHLSERQLVALVTEVTAPTGVSTPAGVAYDAFLTHVRQYDGQQLDRIFATMRNLSFRDIGRMYAEGSKLNERQLTVLFTKLSRLSSEELAAFISTTSKFTAHDLGTYLADFTR